jgi:hypothetical protein
MFRRLLATYRPPVVHLNCYFIPNITEIYLSVIITGLDGTVSDRTIKCELLFNTSFVSHFLNCGQEKKPIKLGCTRNERAKNWESCGTVLNNF